MSLPVVGRLRLPRFDGVTESGISSLPTPLQLSNRQQDSPVKNTCNTSALTELFGDSLTLTDNPRHDAFQWLTSQTSEGCPYDEATLIQRFSLASLYFSLNGQEWNNSDKWLSTESECSWNGISCLEKNGMDLVSVISLGNNNLSGGPIPGNIISQFDQLTELRLSNNRITGRIPDGLYDLNNLIVMSLSHNQLTGTISEKIGGMEKLTNARLGSNKFSGSIPAAFADLLRLEALGLELNQLTGPVPGKICSLESLKTFQTDCGSPPDPPRVKCPADCCTKCFSNDDRVGAEDSSSSAPTSKPQKAESKAPTLSTKEEKKTQSPSSSPTLKPTRLPTASPTASPTKSPTQSPTASPTKLPSFSPTISFQPTRRPTKNPTSSPTTKPSESPTAHPTPQPTSAPTVSAMPSTSPSSSPTKSPTRNPSAAPSAAPTPYASYFESEVLITISNMPNLMSNESISVFEQVMTRFLDETYPEDPEYKDYEVLITKLEVLSQTLSLPGTDNIFVISGNRTHVLAGTTETNLLVGMVVGGEVHPYNPGDHFIFADFVLNGLEQNYNELSDRLRSSGNQAFAMIPESGIRGVQIGGLSNQASIAVLTIIILTLTAIAFVLCCCYCRRRKRRQLEATERDHEKEELRPAHIARDEGENSYHESEPMIVGGVIVSPKTTNNTTKKYAPLVQEDASTVSDENSLQFPDALGTRISLAQDQKARTQENRNGSQSDKNNPIVDNHVKPNHAGKTNPFEDDDDEEYESLKESSEETFEGSRVLRDLASDSQDSSDDVQSDALPLSSSRGALSTNGKDQISKVRNPQPRQSDLHTSEAEQISRDEDKSVGQLKMSNEGIVSEATGGRKSSKAQNNLPSRKDRQEKDEFKEKSRKERPLKESVKVSREEGHETEEFKESNRLKNYKRDDHITSEAGPKTTARRRSQIPARDKVTLQDAPTDLKKEKIKDEDSHLRPSQRRSLTKKKDEVSGDYHKSPKDRRQGSDHSLLQELEDDTEIFEVPKPTSKSLASKKSPSRLK